MSEDKKDAPVVPDAVRDARESGGQPANGQPATPEPQAFPGPAMPGSADEAGSEAFPSEPSLADIETVFSRYKKINIAYKVMRFAGVAIVAVFVGMSVLGITPVFIGMMVAFLLAWLILTMPKQAPFDYGILNVILSTYCDPYGYVNGYQRLTEYAKPGTHEHGVILINLALGSLMQGNPQAVRGLLEQVNVPALRPDGLHGYYDVCARYYFASGKVAELETVRGYIEQVSADHGEKAQGLKMACDNTLANIEMYLAVLARDPERAAEPLERRARALAALPPEQPSQFLWVEYHFISACCDHIAQRWTPLQDHCIYVIEHGNTLYYVQQAAALLREIPSLADLAAAGEEAVAGEAVGEEAGEDAAPGEAAPVGAADEDAAPGEAAPAGAVGEEAVAEAPAANCPEAPAEGEEGEVGACGQADRPEA